MRFSVVLATYNRAKQLDDCLQSIFNQDYSKKEYEVIVVEDGSKEGEAVCKNYEVKYLWQENSGPGAARNLGIKQAKGEIIAMTDDDCVVPSDWLGKLDEGYKRYPEVVGVGGYLEASAEMLASNAFARYEQFTSQQDYRSGQSVEEVSGFENPAGGTNNLSYKKSIIEEVGYFDESLNPAGEDGDLKKRITDKGYKLLYIPLKVEHHRDYTLESFKKQSFNRGWGSYLVQKKRGMAPAKNEVGTQLFFTFPKFILSWLTASNKQFAYLTFIFKVQEYKGMLHAISLNK